MIISWDGGQKVIREPTADEIGATPTPEEAREAEIARLRAARQAAYHAEADPINKKWQRGEAEKEDWLAAVEAIRARYPYPE